MAKMKMQIIYCGHMCTDKAWISSDAEVMARQNFSTGTVEKKLFWMKSPSYVVYIEHPEGKILFDTSVTKDWKKRWPIDIQEWFPYYGDEEELFENRLKQLNIKPGDIDYLVISHLHFDHCGNNDLFLNTKAGSNIIVHEKELESAKISGGAYVREDWDIPGLQYKTVKGDFELVKDVTLIELPGHTAGQYGLMVKLDKEGTFIFTSDAIYTKENYGPPSVRPGIILDSVMWDNTVEKVRKLAKDNNAKVMLGHDYEDVTTKWKLAPQYYE